MKKRDKAREVAAFGRLLDIMDDLREKCPWDKKQTIASLRHLTIEELYELVDAITDNDWDGIKEELGDLLLHIVFYARIASEEDKFTIADVIDELCEKLIKRHPHIYGNLQVSGDEEVKKNWEKLKLKEGKTSIMSGVPRSLPAMVKAYRIQEKARQVGFEWETAADVFEKIREELQELHQVAEAGQFEDKRKIEDELGDLLFSIINYARYVGVDPENALEKTNKKFLRRFAHIEAYARASNKDLSAMSLEEMDEIWNQAKSNEQPGQ